METPSSRSTEEKPSKRIDLRALNTESGEDAYPSSPATPSSARFRRLRAPSESAESSGGTPLSRRRRNLKDLSDRKLREDEQDSRLERGDDIEKGYDEEGGDKENALQPEDDESEEIMPSLIDSTEPELVMFLSFLHLDRKSELVPDGVFLSPNKPVNNAGIKEETIRELEKLIRKEMQRTQFLEGGTVEHRPEEGFFATETPSLIPLLAPREHTVTSDSKKEAEGSQSRMTSRILRALVMIQQRLLTLSAASLPGNDMHTAAVDFLHIINGLPLMRQIENPVGGTLMNLRVPDPCMPYGGQIGQWTELATTLDRLGPLLGSGGQKNLSRSVLRVHLHKIKLLHHPFFSEEQTIYATLLRQYSDYARLVQGHYLDYLTSRFLGILSKLESTLPEALDGEDIAPQSDEDALMRMGALYYDLLDTLSKLLENKLLLVELCQSLSGTWQKLRDIRRNKGFTNTVGVLQCRKIMRSGDEATTGRAGRRKRIAKDIRGRKVYALQLFVTVTV